MFSRLVTPAVTPFALDLTEHDLLADLDPGWLVWRVARSTELTTAA